MNNIQIQNKSLETFAWGAIFIWWGITEMVKHLPAGTGLIGIGLILLGLNAARHSRNIPTSGFTWITGGLALTWGSLELAGATLRLPFEMPIFAILLIMLGGILLGRELAAIRDSKQEI